MKFNPITKEVYTDKDEFVKQLSCPYKMNWNDLEVTKSALRKCSKCDHFIINTEYLTDTEILSIVTQNRDTCLRVDLNQNNVYIITNGIPEQK
jgi:hypothetical protein